MIEKELFPLAANCFDRAIVNINHHRKILQNSINPFIRESNRKPAADENTCADVHIIPNKK